MAAGGGVEGDELPPCSTETQLAVIAARFMSDGAGGLDAGWLPVVVELLGVQDVERLLWDLLTIKSWEPADKRQRPAPVAPPDALPHNGAHHLATDRPR